MAFFSCSASALSWSSSFILAKLVGSQSAAAAFTSDSADDQHLCSSLLSPPRCSGTLPSRADVGPPAAAARSPPPTDPQVSADRPTDLPQPAAGGLRALLFLLIHVAAAAVVSGAAAAAVAVPLDLLHLLLLVFVVVVGGGDAPLMARSRQTNAK